MLSGQQAAGQLTGLKLTTGIPVRLGGRFMAQKVHHLDDERVGFFCPGCKCWHGVRIAGDGHPRWLWNGSLESPTFTPSISIAGVCHSFVINGTIQFLLGSTHSRSGQTIEIPNCDGHAEAAGEGFVDCTHFGRSMRDKNAIVPNSPLSGFVHKTLANGLVISTCLHCMKSIGSPTPTSLRMAEENHPCASSTRQST